MKLNIGTSIKGATFALRGVAMVDQTKMKFNASIDGYGLKYVKVSKDEAVPVYVIKITVPASEIKDANELVRFVREGCVVEFATVQLPLELQRK